MTFALEVVVGPSATEAAALAWDGARILFSRPADNELWAFEPATGAASVFRRFTGGVTGVAADRNGRVFGCQTPSRRMVTYHDDGSASVLETQLDGRFHNFPRYATVDRSGRVWFADPRLQLRAPGPQVFPLLDHASVLRLDPAADRTWTLTRMTFDTQHPTVVAVSSDESTLYVVDTPSAGRQELRAYPIADDGLGGGSVLTTFATADGQPPVTGIAAGPRGHLVVAGGERISVLAVGGQMVAVTEVPGGATDVVLAGEAEGVPLYVTTGDGALIRGDATGEL